MTSQQQYEIIDLVVIIFQNVGIKRIIDKIDILKNYQIYFQICKVIFPQTMIELLRFSQGSLTNSQKIQGVIDIVGKILQNDLYHISGESIAEGKLSHIRNFLHILQLLSQNVHKGNGNEEQVQSAPQNTRSMSDYDQEGHYTVIGIDKQFQRQFQDEDGMMKDNYGEQEEEEQTKRQFKNHTNINPRAEKTRTQSESSQSQGPMNPILDKKRISVKKSNKKTKKPNINYKQAQIYQAPVTKPKSIPLFTFAPKKRQPVIPLQKLLARTKPQENIRKKIKSSFVKKINFIIQDFEAKKIIDKKLQHQEWVRKHDRKMAQKQNQIQNQSKQRIQFTNQHIKQRAKQIDTIKTQKWTMDVMKNLFKQQKQIWEGMRKAKQQSQLEQIQSIIRNHWNDESLLRQALTIANNGVSRK